MSEPSIDHAEKHLSDLIDRALEGEGVTITRDGRAVVRAFSSEVDAGSREENVTAQNALACNRSRHRVGP